MASKRVRLTLPRIAEFTCPADKSQAFLWDSDEKRLAVRCTPATSRKTFIFESRIQGRTIRVTIGLTSVWTIDDARSEARRLQRLIDQGKDPRIEKSKQIEEHATARSEAKTKAAIVSDAFKAFTKAQGWSDTRAAFAGRVTISRHGRAHAPLSPLMELRLSDIRESDIEAVFERNNDERPIVTRNAISLWLQFCRWCERQDKYRGLIKPEAYSPELKRQHAKKSTARTDCLQREQLPAFFASLEYEDEITGAAIAAILLTGARKNEILNLKWQDVDFTWRQLEISDKVSGRRTIPLTPYLSELLSGLPRRNDFVFSGRAVGGRQSQTTVNQALTRVLDRAGIPHVSVHGLRRSFGSLAEWVEVPTGVVAQVMGHAPSAIAEKHYRVRPIDLLRQWHCRIEGWILDQAGIEHTPSPASEQPDPLENLKTRLSRTDKTDETSKPAEKKPKTRLVRTDKTAKTTKEAPTKKTKTPK